MRRSASQVRQVVLSNSSFARSEEAAYHETPFRSLAPATGKETSREGLPSCTLPGRYTPNQAGRNTLLREPDRMEPYGVNNCMGLCRLQSPPTRFCTRQLGEPYASIFKSWNTPSESFFASSFGRLVYH